MIDGLPLGGWTNVGALGLLLATIWLVFTGRLIPRRYHEEIVGRILDELAKAQTGKEIADRNASDAMALAQSMTDMNMALVRQKDASLAAVESVKAYAERGGEDP